MKKAHAIEEASSARSPRSSRRRPHAIAGQVTHRGEHIRDGLLAEIRGAVAATALQLVEDEVTERVGEPWSRKGGSTLRRNGHTLTTILGIGKTRGFPGRGWTVGCQRAGGFFPQAKCNNKVARPAVLVFSGNCAPRS